ncbi:MAG: PD-(D/E)XK nuclease family protein [Anaerolineales bacterium]|jgi:RecB family exonuclease
MKLPDNFVFSQGSLQDYRDCRRRFQLRYLQRLAWPAVQAEPQLENERHMQLGARFHRLVQQHLSGVPADRLTPAAEDEKLALWWRNFLASRDKMPALGGKPLLELPLEAEITLSAPLLDTRLVAKFDLIAAAPDGRLVIFDWKTSSRRPRRSWLAQRLQTRVYPYLLVRAGRDLNRGQPVSPEQVTLVYWFAGFPDDPERFSYQTADFERDAADLEALVSEISRLGPDEFDLTDVFERCRFCQYRSLCDRGEKAGFLDEGEVDDEPAGEFEADLYIDLEAVTEIGYD